MFYHTASRKILKMSWWWPLHSLGLIIIYIFYDVIIKYQKAALIQSDWAVLIQHSTVIRNVIVIKDGNGITNFHMYDCQALNKIKSSLKSIWFKLTLKSLLGKGLKKCTRCIALCTSCIALCTSCIALCTICIRRVQKK